MVSFNEIPNLLLTPGVHVEYDGSRGMQGSPALPVKVYLIGSMLSSGTAEPGEKRQILRDTDGVRYFGARSQLAHMCDKFKDVAKFTEVWAIGLEDAGGAAAHTKTITFSGTATSGGVLHFLVHGIRIPVPITEGMTASEAATETAERFSANSRIMYTAADAAEVVTLTFVHGGEIGNDADALLNFYPRQELDAPDGLTVEIADGVAGTLNPDVQDAIDVFGADWPTIIVNGYSDDANVAAMEDELEMRWGPMVQRDAVQFVGIRGTFSDMTTYANARNSQFTVLLGGGGLEDSAVSPPWEIAAATAGVSTTESDPGRPRQTMAVRGIIGPHPDDRFETPELDLLLQAGVSTFTVDTDGTVRIQRLVTTYKTNAQGLPDDTFRNYNAMLLLAAIRFTTRARFSTKYPRHKLGNDGGNYAPGQKVMTPSVARGEMIALAREWESNAWIEDVDQYIEELVVVRNSGDPDRLDAQLGPNLINQFRVLAAQVQFIV